MCLEATITQNSISALCFIGVLHLISEETEPKDCSLGQKAAMLATNLTLGPLVIVAGMVEGVVRLIIGALIYLISLPFGEESALRDYSLLLFNSAILLDESSDAPHSSLECILAPFVISGMVFGGCDGDDY